MYLPDFVKTGLINCSRGVHTIVITIMEKYIIIKSEVERLLEDASERLTQWLEETGIKLAIPKSEAVLFTRKISQNRMNIMI